jgi:hypothetical protein
MRFLTVVSNPSLVWNRAAAHYKVLAGAAVSGHVKRLAEYRRRFPVARFARRQLDHSDRRLIKSRPPSAGYLVDAFAPGGWFQPTWWWYGSRTRDSQFPRLVLYLLS